MLGIAVGILVGSAEGVSDGCERFPVGEPLGTLLG